MGSTLSTAHRVQFRRALYLHYFDDKFVREFTTVQMRGVGNLGSLERLRSLGSLENH